MSRTVKIDLKEEDYFGNITFIDGKLDQFIIQVYPHKDRTHSDQDILDALAGLIATELGSLTDSVRTQDLSKASTVTEGEQAK